MTREEYIKKWNEANKEKIREYGRRYYLKNKEMIRAKTDAWKAANRKAVCEMAKRSQQRYPERVAARRARHRAENREVLLAKSRAYREKNKDALNEQNRLHQIKKRGRTPEQVAEWHARNAAVRASGLSWRQRNLERVRAYDRARIKNNPQAAMRKRLSARMQKWLIKRGVMKSAKTMSLVGINYSGFIAHIESLFKPGMSWHNRSEWHLDHIRPCASFDLTDPAQQMACFNYKNLQPLWALDNILKSDKILPHVHIV